MKARGSARSIHPEPRFPGDTEGEFSPRRRILRCGAGRPDGIETTSSYVICSSPRCGSWLLALGLAHTGVAGFPAEFFLPSDTAAWSAQWGARRFDDYVSAMRSEATSTNGVLGVKLMWGHVIDLVVRAQESPACRGLALPELLGSLFPGVRYVWLSRRDKLRQAVSHARALQTATWSWDGRPRRKSEPRYDADQIRALLMESTSEDLAWRRFLVESGQPQLHVLYEDLASSYDATLRRVLDFIGVDVETVPIAKPELRRQADPSTEQWVRRFAEAHR